MLKGTSLYLLVNTQESLDRTMACISDELAEVFESIYIIGSPGAEFKVPSEHLISGVYDDMSLAAGLNVGRSLSIVDRTNAFFLRSGSEFDPEDLIRMIQECEDEEDGITMATIIDSNNRNLEFTHTPGELFPQPLFQKGERLPGYTDAWWLDGPAIFISLETLIDVGAFDVAMGDSYCIVDFTVRARWIKHNISICHSSYVTFVNLKPYDLVFIDRTTQVFFLCRANFKRKYGGSILQTLTSN